MLKKIINFRNLISALVIIILLLFSVVLLWQRERMEQASVAIAQLAQTKMALSIYLAERGAYPPADNVLLGNIETRIICLADVPDPDKVLVSDPVTCQGRILLDFQEIGLASPFLYNASGVSYRLEFNLPYKLGAFKKSGLYCATESGIVPGRCLHE